MSDYLWDRTGERDAEVERLETLLGAFAHGPRPLELPAEESVAAPRPRSRFAFARRAFASRLFAPAGLAAAAAVALVIFGAAALMLQRARSQNDGVRSAARSQEAEQGAVVSTGAEQAPRVTPPEAASRAPESVARVGEVKPEASEVVSKPGESKVEKGAVERLVRGQLRRKGLQAASASGREKVARVERGGGATDEVFTFEAMRAGGGASAFVENTRLVAKERLVYALRLTGAKLRDVRQKTQGLEGPESRPR